MFKSARGKAKGFKFNWFGLSSTQKQAPPLEDQEIIKSQLKRPLELQVEPTIKKKHKKYQKSDD